MYLCCFRFEELKAQKEAEEKTKEEAQKKEELGEKHLILTNLKVSPYRRKQISYQFNTETHHFTDNTLTQTTATCTVPDSSYSTLNIIYVDMSWQYVFKTSNTAHVSMWHFCVICRHNYHRLNGYLLFLNYLELTNVVYIYHKDPLAS